MNKAELVNELAERTGVTKKAAENFIKAFQETVTDALSKKEKVVIVGFGTFGVKSRPARKGRNPQTGKEMDIPASNVPGFKCGKLLKDAVNSKK